MEILYNKINKKVTRGGVISASRGNQYTEQAFIGHPVKIPVGTGRNFGGTGGGWILLVLCFGGISGSSADSL